MKKTFLIIALLIVTQIGFSQEKPNVIYILVDNWGWGDIGVQGGTTPTPRIDKFASEGMRFTN